MPAVADKRDEWLAPKEFAYELRVSVSSIYRAIDAGRLEAVRLSDAGALRIHRSQLERLVTTKETT